LLSSLASAGIDRIFVVGGDADQSGPYADAISLMRQIKELGYQPREIGIGCYPQGHPSIPDERLLAALSEKAPFADYMASQLCFDADALRAWVAARRAQGLALPLDIGVPGALDPAHLLRVSARIGVTDAARYVVHQRGVLGRLLRPGGYRPDRLLHEMAPVLADPGAGIRGLHVYTFNQLARTQDWRASFARTF
jgi:methylenetetrahydrofolate reductase (NADPH)